ncbi:MAG: CCA tRNA nucleotidyltransferase [archaeon]
MELVGCPDLRTLQEVLDTVARRVTPSNKERMKVTSLAERLRTTVAGIARSHGLEAEVRIDGSVAKDTWLSGEADIDVFMLVSPDLSRKSLETECLDIVREAAGKYVERFAEHPYVETYVDGMRANIVPCYKVEKGHWKSATDRTPYHTQYMRERLDDDLRRQVRLAKKFTKGIEVYGAEVRTSGFSGMLCETLIIHHRTFENLASEARSWRNRHVVDVEGYYHDHREDLEDLFPSSLIVIDPVDRGRNVAAAVAQDKMWSFVAACRTLIDRPKLDFFFPRTVKALTVPALKRKLKNSTALVCIQLGFIDAVVDVLWSQLYKTERSLRNLLKTTGFTVLRSSSWTNEKDKSVILFELEQAQLPLVHKRLGPPVWRKQESKDFLKKHLGAADTVSGPMVEEGRWVVHKRRKTRHAVQLLKEKMRDGGRDVGVAAKVAITPRKDFRLSSDDRITKLYETDQGFARFLTNYLVGRPFWLERPSSR